MCGLIFIFHETFLYFTRILTICNKQLFYYFGGSLMENLNETSKEERSKLNPFYRFDASKANDSLYD